MKCAEHQHLKSVALRNTRSTFFAYAIPAFVYSPIVVLAGLTTTSLWSFALLYGITAIFIMANIIAIKRLPSISYELGAPVLYVQIAFFMLMFLCWIIMLEQGRYGGLFFALSMLVYTYSYGSKKLAIVMNTLVIAFYLLGSYLVLKQQTENVNLTRDLLAVIAFLPASMLISRSGSKLAIRNRRIKALLAEQRDTEKKLQETLTQLKLAASTDELTGLINRREINNRLNYEYEKMNREHKSMSVLILDLDHFKQINDNYGHPCGDFVLKHVADCLQKAFRSTDSVSRWGGEEFIVLMPATPITEAEHVCQRALNAIAESSVPWQGQTLQVTASDGLSEIDPRNTIENALKLADECLYRAKQQGRNKLVTSIPARQVG